MTSNDARDAVAVAPVLPTPVRGFVRALEERGRLAAVACPYAYDSKAFPERILPRSIAARLAPRHLEGIDFARVHRRLGPEIALRIRRALPAALRSDTTESDALHRAVDRYAARQLIKPGIRLVLAREDGARASFARARSIGARTLYDLPIAHHATLIRILEAEEERFPGISEVPGIRDLVTPERIEHKEAELADADTIVVGSGFVARSLEHAGWPESRIRILPYACEESLPDADPGIGAEPRDRILHVGQLGIRKGTHRLLHAWKRLGAPRTHRLVLIGHMRLSASFLSGFRGCYEHIPHLPRAELWSHYRRASAFALPSAAEGFATVLLEALSCGVPLVASRNSGADTLIEHGTHGLMHEFDDEDALCTQLERILSNETERAEMGRAAHALSRTWTWREFREAFARIADESAHERR